MQIIFTWLFEKIIYFIKNIISVGSNSYHHLANTSMMCQVYYVFISSLMTNFPFYRCKTVVKVVKRLGPGHTVIELHLNPEYLSDSRKKKIKLSNCSDLDLSLLLINSSI